MTVTLFQLLVEWRSVADKANSLVGYVSDASADQRFKKAYEKAAKLDEEFFSQKVSP